MKVFAPAAVLVVATVFLTLSVAALILAPPVRLDSRDVLVLAEAVAGLLLFAVATRRFGKIQQTLAER